MTGGQAAFVQPGQRSQLWGHGAALWWKAVGDEHTASGSAPAGRAIACSVKELRQ